MGRTNVVAADKKQKVMLGVLASLIVGMGGVYWFVIRGGDSGGGSLAGETGGQKVKRERGTTQKGKKKRSSRATRGRVEKAEKTIRETSDRKSRKKSRRGSRASKVKKKKKTLPPAAYLPPKEDWLEDFDPNSFRPRLA